MTIFKGLKHFPLGPVILTTIPEYPERMEARGIGNSSFDGVSIQTNGASQWEAKFAPVPMTPGAGLTATYNIRDNWGRNKTVAQYALATDPDTGNAVLAVNSKFICSHFRLVGMRNGVDVFSRDYVKPNDPSCNWLPVAIFILSVVVAAIDAVDYTKVEEKDGAGKVTKTTTTTSFGGAGMVAPGNGDGSGFEDEQYDVDHLYISFSNDFGPVGEPYSHQGKISEVQIAAKGFETLTFIDEVFSMEEGQGQPPVVVS